MEEERRLDTLENAYYKLNVVSMVVERLSDPAFKMTRQEAMGLRVITEEIISTLEGYAGQGR